MQAAGLVAPFDLPDLLIHVVFFLQFVPAKTNPPRRASVMTLLRMVIRRENAVLVFNAVMPAQGGLEL